MSLSAIKRVMEILNAGNAFVTTHEWIQDVWEVCTIGFITKFSPAHHQKHLATEYVNDRTKHDTSMPQFCLRQTMI
jgi:hypothetical protein